MATKKQARKIYNRCLHQALRDRCKKTKPQRQRSQEAELFSLIDGKVED